MSRPPRALAAGPTPTFAAKVDYTTGAGSKPDSVALGDVNGDSKLDIVTANRTANQASVLLGNGNGTFAAKTDFTTGAGPKAGVLGDVNDDGKLDIVTANYTSNNASVLLNTTVMVPAAPTALVATGGDGSASVAFTAGSDGGAAITNYQYSTDGGTVWTALSPAATTSPVTIAGLTNGTTVTIGLRAVNSAGTGAASTPSTPVPPVPPVPAVVAPGVPGAPTVAAGDGQVTVTVAPPTTGGTPASYTVTASPGGATCAVSGATGSCTITGLTNGTAYTFTVTATNTAGTSAPSGASAPVTPTSTSVLDIKFIDLPTQIVPGQLVLFVLDVTATRGTLDRSLIPRATVGVNGSALIKVNGVELCTAIITNGKGSCAGTVNATGTLTFTAEFNGSVSGVAGTTTGLVTAYATTGSVAINRARMRARLHVGRCSIKLRLRGMDAAAGREITIWMKKGKKNVKLGTTKSGDNKAWKFRTTGLTKLKATVWASDGKFTTAKLKVRVTKNRDGTTPTLRGC